MKAKVQILGVNGTSDFVAQIGIFFRQRFGNLVTTEKVVPKGQIVSFDYVIGTALWRLRRACVQRYSLFCSHTYSVGILTSNKLARAIRPLPSSFARRLNCTANSFSGYVRVFVSCSGE